MIDAPTTHEETSERIADAMKPLVRRDAQTAAHVYAAFCNVAWVPLNYPANAWEEVDTKDVGTFSTTWRFSGELVAQWRGQGETYLDWYCSPLANEGTVTDEIRQVMEEAGFRPILSQP